ncbi:hypothetical protein [Flavobacterium sp.]|uniref:hypothetical protein n=1 Tax=Flavobacterium sp. TaxID=239 RepID=UPI0031E01167
MRNFIWSLLLFSSLTTISYSQTKSLEKGTYVSTNKGQKVKLNLSEDNKFELVYYTGKYEIKGDSLLFAKNQSSESRFNLLFKNDKKAKNIKIKFLDPSYYSFYIGTQKGNEEIKYQKLADLRAKYDPDWKSADVEFEIDKTDILYLVYESYSGKSDVYKYALPKDVSEITISYDLSILEDLNITGFFDKKTNELKIYDQSGQYPLAFINEKDSQPVKNETVVPLETKSVTNWTYPGKNTDYYSTAIDSTKNVAIDTTAVPAYSAVTRNSHYDFKLKIENNLSNALKATKESNNKYLVVYNDSKKTAKESFDTFIKDQEEDTGYYMYDAYNSAYDVYNYYLAGEGDKKWLKTNKITNDPSVIILNREGDKLAIAKSDLKTQKDQFNNYGDLYKRLQRADAFVSIEKTLKNKNANDEDSIRAFNKGALLAGTYNYDSTYKQDVNSTDFIITKTPLDQKEVAQAWKKLIEAHQKDTKPDMYLVETIIKEIQNEGFTKGFFNKDKSLTDTDFLAIDYVLKHSDKIEENRDSFNGQEIEVHNIGNAVSEVSNALQQNSSDSQNGISSEINKQKIISTYKKIIDSGKANFDTYRNYFTYLSQTEEKEGSNTKYLKEFKTFFDSNLSGTNPIEKLDTLFSGLNSSSNFAYDGWNSFKIYNSDLCNNAAWSIVTNPINESYLKDAIKWSEYSVAITKNNSYYLDTLAQLYYKDGQKDKAIATETLAVKYLDSNVEETTANEIKEVLNKMQDGTY